MSLISGGLSYFMIVGFGGINNVNIVEDLHYALSVAFTGQYRFAGYSFVVLSFIGFTISEYDSQGGI